MIDFTPSEEQKALQNLARIFGVFPVMLRERFVAGRYDRLST